MLILGTDKTDTILRNLPRSFLLIDDGEISDQLAGARLDFSHHSFNPLKGMNYLRARQLVEILGAVFPQGENTLTKKNSDFILLKALTEKRRPNHTKYLDDLFPIPNPKDNAAVDAYHKIETILLSPLLKRVFLNPTNFSLSGTILARLNRVELGDFDCFILGNLLISQYRGHVVIPDFGFYAHPGHIALMHRLTAGVNFLTERRITPEIRDNLLLMESHACRTTYPDAVTLALSAGLRPDLLREDNPYNAFIDAAIGG